MAKQGTFKPDEHFRNLKGQQYLECKWRVVWFREEHGDGYITTDLIEHDAAIGLAVFKARVGHYAVIGETQEGYLAVREVYATGYGSETRKDFNDYLEKAETKAIGRALAMLGYGTAQAIELDEEERIVDSPVEQQPAQGRTLPPKPPKDTTARAVALQRAQDLLSRDPEAREKLPKPLEQQTDEEVQKLITWLVRRDTARRQAQQPAPPSRDDHDDAAEVDADVGNRIEELTAYVNDVDAHLQAMKGTRGPLTADRRGTWAALYTRGQALAGPAAGEDSRPVVDLKPNEIATACSRFVQSCLAELSGSG